MMTTSRSETSLAIVERMLLAHKAIQFHLARIKLAGQKYARTGRELYLDAMEYHCNRANASGLLRNEDKLFISNYALSLMIDLSEETEV